MNEHMLPDAADFIVPAALVATSSILSIIVFSVGCFSLSSSAPKLLPQ